MESVLKRSGYVNMITISRLLCLVFCVCECVSTTSIKDEVLLYICIIYCNRSSPLSNKTHSWSLSDYNSSVTSSSSRSSHVMSPGYRIGSPKSADSFEHKKWTPLHRDYSVFTVPEESKDKHLEENQQHDRLFVKSGGRPSEGLSSRLKFGKTTRFLYDDRCTLPQEKNSSHRVYKRH